MIARARPVTYDTHPSRYKHWKLSVDGAIATLALDVAEDGGIRPGYALKLNSYDLGVDIELHDAVQRIRFEHPRVRTVIVTSAKDRVFCSGANIYMLGTSTHAWKVNFCKFTNETRNGFEDSSRYSGIKFLAACNGTTAGGGYELALACDEIILVDDRSSTVSLPEVSLLGVLPGTGGLTRLTDKRKVRRDYADVFCTTTEGVRAGRAEEWGLVDTTAKTHEFPEVVRRRALELAESSQRPADAVGVELTPLARTIDEDGYHYEYVDVQIDRAARSAAITVRAPRAAPPLDVETILAHGVTWWPLQMVRELDDAILMLRTNDLEVGTWLLRARGDVGYALGADASLEANKEHWFVREVVGMLRRTLARLDVSSRSMFAIVDREACFAGTLLELALAADRSYMLAANDGPQIVLSDANFGLYPEVNGRSRLDTRFCGDEAAVASARSTIGKRLDSQTAVALGLITSAPDELDWDEELRIALEERASLSPDALTGLEANLRFPVFETMETRIFGRLSAWQNWIFTRPNAAGESGALTIFGKGTKPNFDRQRV
jgi:benzoyl-CoA-dihydrodiol lyase